MFLREKYHLKKSSFFFLLWNIFEFFFFFLFFEVQTLSLLFFLNMRNLSSLTVLSVWRQGAWAHEHRILFPRSKSRGDSESQEHRRAERVLGREKGLSSQDRGEGRVAPLLSAIASLRRSSGSGQEGSQEMHCPRPGALRPALG